MTPEALRSIQSVAPKRRNKYRAQPIVIEGFRFHSISEGTRWLALRSLERTGKIRDLRRQVAYPLTLQGVNGELPILIRSERYPNGRHVKITLDFEYVDTASDEIIREEFKGLDTTESRLRRAVFEAIYNCRVTVTGARK